MLTKYYPQSSFEKKFTVVVIWIIALAMMVEMVQFIIHTDMNILGLAPLVIAGLFVIAGILLRCKIARWFTLLSMYTFIFSPFVAYMMIGESFPIASVALYLSILSISVYVFSNKKAMDLFYIESNPSEHLPLILLALTINAIYIYLVRVV